MQGTGGRSRRVIIVRTSNRRSVRDNRMSAVMLFFPILRFRGKYEQSAEAPRFHPGRGQSARQRLFSTEGMGRGPGFGVVRSDEISLGRTCSRSFAPRCVFLGTRRVFSLAGTPVPGALRSRPDVGGRFSRLFNGRERAWKELETVLDRRNLIFNAGPLLWRSRCHGGRGCPTDQYDREGCIS